MSAEPNRPQPSTVIAVRYATKFTWCLLALGLISLAAGILVLQTGSGYLGFIGLGVLFCVLGVLYRRRTYFTFQPSTQTITVLAPVGPGHRPFYLRPGTQLSRQGNRFVANLADGRRIKLPVYRFMADPDGWNAVAGRVPDLG